MFRDIGIDCFVKGFLFLFLLNKKKVSCFFSSKSNVFVQGKTIT